MFLRKKKDGGRRTGRDICDKVKDVTMNNQQEKKYVIDPQRLHARLVLIIMCQSLALFPFFPPLPLSSPLQKNPFLFSKDKEAGGRKTKGSGARCN